MKIKLSHEQVRFLAITSIGQLPNYEMGRRKAYAIPRGGVPAAYVMRQIIFFQLVETPGEADFFIDDIIDSGATRDRYAEAYPGIPFIALVDKLDPACEFAHDWIIFPWEGDAESGIEDNIRRLLQYVGEDVSREGLAETPKRVAKAWAQWCSGYNQDPAEVMKVFTDGAENCDEMVIVKDIPIYSHCEHHLAAIIGTVTIAYIPNGKIVGLSKLSRLADIYARRLQVQERLTNQIADALEKYLQPKGVGVIIKARHLCMESRGVCKQGHHTITSSLRGVLKEKPEARAEFMELAK
jgi:GTP cyclohydrolase IA